MTVQSTPEKLDLGAHFVQFYDTDKSLVDSVSAFIAASLGSLEGAIIIATREHRERIESGLREHGLDVAGAQARRQFISLDAQETLALFMVDGMPDEARFQATVGKIVGESVKSWVRLRAFGEMVALLWAQGNGKAAIKLEQYWNRLGSLQAFTLFCAYPNLGFNGVGEAQAYEAICREHSHVLPIPMRA